jgi:hypothetical protein
MASQSSCTSSVPFVAERHATDTAVVSLVNV